jgi:aminoglycoside/choline kinase family phosphotransferase
MILKEGIGIIDWQGGRLGPLAYDLASLLIDPYAQLSKEEAEGVYQHYLLLLKEYEFRSLDPFKRSYPYLAIQRNLQILGAFSYLSKAQGKSFFETYIPPAVKTLHNLLDELKDPKLSSLKDVLNTLPSHHTHSQDS